MNNFKGFTPLEIARPKSPSGVFARAPLEVPQTIPTFFLTKLRKIKLLTGRARFLTGFTLIEVLVYLALFSFLLVGALVGVYQIIDSADRVSGKISIGQEGNFLLRKIDWALTGATAICLPAVNTSGQVLKLTKSISKSCSDNPLEFTFSSDNKLWLSQNGGAPIELSSDYTIVPDLNFCYGNDPTAPECALNQSDQIKASFKISDQVGKIIQSFETTKYLRK